MREGSAQREANPKGAAATGQLGDYRLIAKLGSGGQADVFLALSQGPMDVKRLVVVPSLKEGLTASRRSPSPS